MGVIGGGGSVLGWGSARRNNRLHGLGGLGFVSCTSEDDAVYRRGSKHELVMVFAEENVSNTIIS